MVTDNQVRILMKAFQTEGNKATAAAKAGMDAKTARKYERIGKLPSELNIEHDWRTREDPFADVWDEVVSHLEINPGLEAKTLFEYLQRKYSGRFSDGQLRTLQRRIRVWRATEGPPKEVFFPQQHKPGELCQSDFTYMNKLGVTICGQRFDHLIYHFILTYSNWETGFICFSESFESLSAGLQSALWELGGVPKRHQTDRLTAAVQSPGCIDRNHFTDRYSSLLRHYGLEVRMIQTGKPNENGDIEQSHYRFKKALEQTLLLRGSSDFSSRSQYTLFLNKLFSQLNAGRMQRFAEELKVLRRLPNIRLDACKSFRVRVGPSSTICVSHNVYSVNSRLIGETVKIKLYADYFEIFYGQKCIEKIPRLRGEGKHRIQYRHIIDWLVRKPGAFENYRYRRDLFPTHRFRMAYDWLIRNCAHRSNKEYVKILHLAAMESESAVDHALNRLIDQGMPISFDGVNAMLQANNNHLTTKHVQITPVDIGVYDQLLCERLAR